MLGLLWMVLSASASAAFYPYEQQSDPNVRNAVEAAQCSGFIALKSQLAQKAGNMERAEASFYRQIELQTFAALAYANDLGMPDDIAMSEVDRVAERTANRVAQDLLQNFGDTWTMWHSQCSPYVSKAREVVDADSLLGLAEWFFWAVAAAGLAVIAAVAYFVWRRGRLTGR